MNRVVAGPLDGRGQRCRCWDVEWVGEAAVAAEEGIIAEVREMVMSLREGTAMAPAAVVVAEA